MSFGRAKWPNNKSHSARLSAAFLLLCTSGCSQDVTHDPSYHLESLVGRCFELKDPGLVDPTATEDDRALIWQCSCDVDTALIQSGDRPVPSGSRFKIERLMTVPLNFGSDIAVYAVMLDSPYAGIRVRVDAYIEEYTRIEGKPRAWSYNDLHLIPCSAIPTDVDSALIPWTSTTRDTKQ